MTRSRVIFESVETITGRFPDSREWIEYSGLLKIRDAGRQPVSLELTFVPPHPLAKNMPTEKRIRAETVTHIYVKLVRFLWSYGAEFRV